MLNTQEKKTESRESAVNDQNHASFFSSNLEPRKPPVVTMLEKSMVKLTPRLLQDKSFENKGGTPDHQPPYCLTSPATLLARSSASPLVAASA